MLPFSQIRHRAGEQVEPHTDLTKLSNLMSSGDITTFRGEVQPKPKYRLAQARIFLADEDYYCNLNFTQKLADIEVYVALLEKTKYKGDERLIKEIKEMIWVHKCWIAEATQPPALNLQFAKFDHRNRLIGSIKDPEKRGIIAHIQVPRQPKRLSKRLDSGLATHITMEEWNEKNGGQKRLPSPDPFQYSKKVAEFRRAQDSIAVTVRAADSDGDSYKTWSVPASAGFKGPHISPYNEPREEFSKRLNPSLNFAQNLQDHDIPDLSPMPRQAISTIKDARAKGTIDAKSGTTADMDIPERLHNIYNSDEMETIEFLLDQKAVEEAAHMAAYNIISPNQLLRGEVNEDRVISKEPPTIRATEEKVGNKMTVSLTKLAEPLSSGQFISDQEAGRLLQKQIIAENHSNLEERRPDFSQIWACGADIQKQKNFFSLDRWPLELQTIERQKDILKSGPERPSLKKSRETRQATRQLNRQKDQKRDPKETYIHGKPHFEFGETTFQENALSWQIEQDLANVPQFAHMYTTDAKGRQVLIQSEVDPFALPDIPSEAPGKSHGIISRIMSVLGKRTRDETTEDKPKKIPLWNLKERFK